MTKIRSICVDTLTGIQNNQFMANESKPGHDEWLDYGKDIYNFLNNLQQLGFEIILVLGEPGTGKSTGMRTLPKDTNIWYNADNKNPVWEGGKAEYGKKNAPRGNFHKIPYDYQDIISHIAGGIEKGVFEEERYAILTGHVEDYKSTNTVKQRLKILGKVGTKMQLEGKLEHVFYSYVEMTTSGPKYLLETQNNGLNTARSHMGMFEPKIDNDYGMILEKLIEGI